MLSRFFGFNEDMKIGCKKINIHTDKRYPDEAKELVLNNHNDWADIEKILA